MSALESFAKLLGLRARDAEDALRSDRAARLFLSRRAFMGASALLAAGSCFSFPARAADASVHLIGPRGDVLRHYYPGERIRHLWLTNWAAEPCAVKLVRVKNRELLLGMNIFPSCGIQWNAHSPDCEFVA